MKPYSNKSDRTDSRKCLFSEIKKGDKARKKAKRKESKDLIEDMIAEEKGDYISNTELRKKKKNSITIAIENNMAFDNETEIF
jgi:hypothetical protein